MRFLEISSPSSSSVVRKTDFSRIEPTACTHTSSRPNLSFAKATARSRSAAFVASPASVATREEGTLARRSVSALASRSAFRAKRRTDPPVQVHVPSRTGKDSEHAEWTLNGRVVVRTRESATPRP